MNTYRFLFHWAAVGEDSFLGEDDATAFLTMETNRIELAEVPDLYGDKLAFAKGYVMGREGMRRDPGLPEGYARDYDLGFERGHLTRNNPKQKPHWDQRPITN
jgi:hypothetical protein